MYHIHTKNLLSMKNKTTELVENTQRTVYDTIAIAILFFFYLNFLTPLLMVTSSRFLAIVTKCQNVIGELNDRIVLR